MIRKELLLQRWAAWSAISYKRAFLIVALITLILGIGYSRLQLEMTFYSMMPKSSAAVQDYETINEEFPFASQIIVAVGTDGNATTEQVKKTIDALQVEFSLPEHSEVIESVYSKVDRDFLQSHGLMLTEADDLQRFTDSYSNLNLVPLLRNINDEFEREYTQDADNLEDHEQMAVSQFKALNELLILVNRAAEGNAIETFEVKKTLEDYLFGESYMLSEAENMGIMFLLPTFTMNDFMELERVVEIEEIAKEIASEQGVTVGLTGIIVVGKDEMVTSEQGLGISMVLAFILIMVLMILAFRMNSAPILAGLPLIIGIIWTTGAAGLFIGRLNIITAMYLIALMGLGIDYAIHIFSTYIQSRDEGMDWLNGIIYAYKTSGSGIITGGLTTAAAFGALAFSKTDILSELGIVAGLGILCEMTAMLLLIPPLLGRRHHRLEKKGKPDTIHTRKVQIRSSLTGSIGSFVKAHPGTIATGFLIIGITLSIFAPGVTIEDNLMKMEAKGLESVELQDLLVDEFGMAPDGMSILGTDLAEFERLQEELKELETVASVDSITSYLPSDKKQRIRATLIEEFREILELRPDSAEYIDMWELYEEVFRLEMNLIEMGDMAYLGNMERLSPVLNEITGIDDEGNRYRDTIFDRLATTLETDEANQALVDLQRQVDSTMALLLKNMADPQQITQDMLPDMFSDTFISRDGDKYLLTINAKENPWVGENREAFSSQIQSVTDRATGMIQVADQLTYMATTDGLRSSIIALLVVGIILLLDFRNLKLTLLTYIPLLFSFGSLFGIMALTGIKFDFVNIISVPLLIGIGIDDAVHINHRYRIEGKGNMDRVIAKTGTAVLLTTITTIIGFGSFIPSIMRAMRSTGVVLSVAMALAFIYSIFLHPAILLIAHERFGASLRPWGSKEVQK